VRRLSTTGFTLLEVVCAVLVLAFLLAVTAGIVSGVLLGARRVEEKVSRELELAEAEDIIAEDLAFLAVPSGLPGSPFRLEGVGDARLTFFTAVGSRTAWGEIATPLHRVTYATGPLRGGGTGLFRREVPVVETPGAVYDDAVLLVEGVSSFTVEVYDGREWLDSWIAGPSSGLPLLIRVTVAIKGDGGSQEAIYVESSPQIGYTVEKEERPGQEDEGGGDRDDGREGGPNEGARNEGEGPDSAQAHRAREIIGGREWLLVSQGEGAFR